MTPLENKIWDMVSNWAEKQYHPINDFALRGLMDEILVLVNEESKEAEIKNTKSHTAANNYILDGFISPKVEMPKPSEKNRNFSAPLMLLVGKRKYKGQYNFHRQHFSKAGYHIENYIFPDEKVIGWKLI